MFTNLTKRLSNVVKQLSGQKRLTESNIQSSLRQVRMALLEADVALPVVKDIIKQIQDKAVGQEVVKSVDPGQMLIKIVNDELVHLMGEANESLDLKAQPPVVILMAGLQGSGKTSTVAKLARWLQHDQKKKVMVTSCDVYRPAAIKQLETLAKQIEVGYFPSDQGDKPTDIAAAAIDAAKKAFADVLIIDTAGRLHIDEAMMTEIKALHQVANPQETLFIVDSMTGQDAVNTAKAFHDTLPLTGVILTKVDGDARGGAALSIRQVTGKPIKFLTSGEKPDALDPFHPERIASQILGMGDIVSLVEQAEKKMDKQKTQKLARKLVMGGKFNLEDYRNQLTQMQNMGGLTGIMSKLPGMSQLPEDLINNEATSVFKQHAVIIDSMTKHERARPELLNKGSRKKRIATGSGTTIQDVNRLLKQFGKMRDMMKKTGKPGGLMKMMKQFDKLQDFDGQ